MNSASAPAVCGAIKELAPGSALLIAAHVRAQKRQLKRAGQSRRGGADTFPYMDGGAEASPGCAGLPATSFQRRPLAAAQLSYTLSLIKSFFGSAA